MIRVLWDSFYIGDFDIFLTLYVFIRSEARKWFKVGVFLHSIQAETLCACRTATNRNVC